MNFVTGVSANRARDALFALGVAALLTCAGFVGANGNGSFVQIPQWDSAAFYSQARAFRESVNDDGIRGFVNVWVRGSGTHTPLVPAVSGLLMLALGDSFLAALCALPLFIFLLSLSLVKVVRHLYPGSTLTVWGTPLLTVCFPVVLNQSRIYLYEFPMAAMALACFWAMLASDRFTRFGPSLVCGLLAGLTGLTRGGSPAVLAAGGLVGSVIALSQPPRLVKLRNMLTVVVVAAALWCTWYLPNGATFLGYLQSVTYGSEATVFAGSEHPLTLDNIRYYLVHNVSQGAGAPLLTLAALAWITRCIAARQVVTSRTMIALWTTYGLTFVILMLAAQRCGAILFLPVIAIQAVSIVRAFTNLPWRSARIAAAIAAAGLSAHHLYALTVTVKVDGAPQRAWGPLGRNCPLWDHNDSFLQVTEFFKPGVDYRTGLTTAAHAVLEQPAVYGGSVLLLAHHPFVNSFNFRGLAGRWPKDVKLNVLPLLTQGLVESQRSLLVRDIMAARALIVRTSTPKTRPSEEGRYLDLLESLTNGELRIFDPLGSPIAFEDGSTVKLYLRRPALQQAADAFVRELESRKFPPNVTFCVVSQHPFVRCVTTEVGGLALREGHRLFVPESFSHGDDTGDVLTQWAMMSLIGNAAILTRISADSDLTPVESQWNSCLTPLRTGSRPILEASAEAELPDGSRVVLYTRNPKATAIAETIGRHITAKDFRREYPVVAAIGSSPFIELVRQALHPHCVAHKWELDSFPPIFGFQVGRRPAESPDPRDKRREWKRASALVWSEDPTLTTPISQLSRRLIHPMIAGPTRCFEAEEVKGLDAGLPNRDLENSQVYAPLPLTVWIDSRPEGWKPADARFDPPLAGDDPALSVKLVAYDLHEVDGWMRLDLCFESIGSAGRLPVPVLHFLDPSGAEIESRVLEPLGTGRPSSSSLDGRNVVSRAFETVHGEPWRREGNYSVCVNVTSLGTWKDWTGQAAIPLPRFGGGR